MTAFHSKKNVSGLLEFSLWRGLGRLYSQGEGDDLLKAKGEAMASWTPLNTQLYRTAVHFPICFMPCSDKVYG